MSEMFSSEMEVEEGSPMGGGECSESPVHMMVEPHVELDEDPDHNTLEPKVELEESLVEPHVEFQEGTTDHNENNVYPFDPLAPEYFAETDGTVDSTSSNYQAEAGTHEYSDTTLNGISQDSEDANAAINDNSLCNSVDTSLDATMDTSNSGLMESSLQEDDNTDYNEMQRTYLKDFYSSSAFPTSTDESSDNSFVERIPLSRFPSIVKVVERAEYETIQILYQLLYQRSAWDTQEILSKRILEFSGFAFNKNSEDYYNREMLLQTLPNSVLVKIGAILCLEQVKNVLSNVGLGRHDLINAIMDFLSLPRKKTRASRFNSANNNNKAASQNVEPCGCRNSCLSKFTEAERELLATHHKTIKPKKKAEAYFLSLITINRASKRPDDDAKKHRDYKYSYKIKIGRKEVNVCKGGFMMLHNVKMSMLNSLQLVMKTEKYDKNLLSKVVYPFIEGQEEPEPTPVPTSEADSKDSSTVSESSKVDTDNNQTDDEELKKKLSVKVPAVMVEKIDASKISPKKKKQANNEKDDSKDDAPGTKKDDNVRKKLRDFPLVVKSLDEASETLLIDLHFLLFSSSADSDKLKDNILDFDGFKFSADSEEYDERNEFFQRMSGKLITDVSRALSLGVMSKREETIQNILSFLMKPDESYLRAAGVSVPVILSDVELDDMEGFSDSDESITCEVVEKKVECIDLLSSGEDSDREDGKKKQSIKKEKGVATPKAAPVAAPTAVSSPKTTESVPVSKTTTPTPTTSSAETTTSQSSSSGVVRRLRDFETIRKIVNTHPPEYLVDIYELLFLKKNEADTLRNEILDFTGFTFEKGAPEYVKRKQVLDRMLYNNVRRVYNTLIHNSTEVKVFSKPTMINEIFQFLFKLPDHDTSVRPLPPGAKTLMPKTPTTAAITTKAKISPAPSAPPTSAPASILPSQSGKLSDLKRVFQRVACFPCEYLVDVHKLLFMTDCDPKVIRQNIFGFKGFSFSVDSTEFQQRKMYLEYLTFHSLRKISSVLTTRSVDLRNSTKHELASHLTDVLAEYCNTCIDTESITPTSAKENATTTAATTATTTTTVTSTTSEEIVVTPSIQSVQSVAPTATAASKTTKSAKSKNNPLNISIVETHSIKSPTKTTSSPARGSRKRKSQTVRQMVSEKKTPPPPASDFADIHLPEVEQYRQIYGANLNVYLAMAESGNSIENVNTIVEEVDVHHYGCSQPHKVSSIINHQDSNVMVEAPENIEVVPDISELSSQHTNVNHPETVESSRIDSADVCSTNDNIVEGTDNIEAIPGSSEILSQHTSVSHPKTAVERMREYRARKRKKIETANNVSSTINHQNENVIVGATDNIEFIPSSSELFSHQSNISRPKTALERMREYRARKKKNKIKKPPKTATERVREHRARKKKNTIPKKPKTAAERMREYRARKKSLTQSTNHISSINHHQDNNIIVEATENIKNELEYDESFHQNVNAEHPPLVVEQQNYSAIQQLALSYY